MPGSEESKTFKKLIYFCIYYDHEVVYDLLTHNSGSILSYDLLQKDITVQQVKNNLNEFLFKIFLDLSLMILSFNDFPSAHHLHRMLNLFFLIALQ